MSQIPSDQAIRAEKQDLASSAKLFKNAKSNLTKIAAWINDRNIPFLVSSIGMIVMLLWAGSYKMTAPGGLVGLLIERLHVSPMSSARLLTVGEFFELLREWPPVTKPAPTILPRRLRALHRGAGAD